MSRAAYSRRATRWVCTAAIRRVRVRWSIWARGPDGMPVGTGPFRVTRFEPDRRLSLAAFEEHFGECDSCRAYLRSYREAIRMARQTLAVPPIQSAESEQIVSAILLAVRREGKK